jgi:hypothetical protein
MIECCRRSKGQAMAGCAILGVALLIGGCGHENKVTRVDTGTVTDLSGRWNDTDSRMVAETLVKEAVGSPWLDNFAKAKTRQPVVIVGTIVNKSEVREERREQAVHAREDTQKAPGRELGADYMMRGSISTILDEQDATKAVFYQVDLEMVDLENNIKSWFGQKKIKKVIEKKRTIF